MIPNLYKDEDIESNWNNNNSSHHHLHYIHHTNHLFHDDGGGSHKNPIIARETITILLFEIEKNHSTRSNDPVTSIDDHLFHNELSVHNDRHHYDDDLHHQTCHIITLEAFDSLNHMKH
ncbi:hypothetical protein SSS_04238 [Sarcoptes scabiei]|uniref:Uncharacterized protein n=1 Tax=Sarcoptes scabiei TaxID=52283 RepID=A0A834RAQ1_SARSC|nr:hypothetical protein SSS_04238 [Sarcoptes scabiei]